MNCPDGQGEKAHIIFKELQSKSTVWYHYMPIRMVPMQRSDKNAELVYILSGLEKLFGGICSSSVCVHWDPPFPLGVDPGEGSVCVQQKTFMLEENRIDLTTLE